MIFVFFFFWFFFPILIPKVKNQHFFFNSDFFFFLKGQLCSLHWTPYKKKKKRKSWFMWISLALKGIYYNVKSLWGGGYIKHVKRKVHVVIPLIVDGERENAFKASFIRRGRGFRNIVIPFDHFSNMRYSLLIIFTCC